MSPCVCSPCVYIIYAGEETSSLLFWPVQNTCHFLHEHTTHMHTLQDKLSSISILSTWSYNVAAQKGRKYFLLRFHCTTCSVRVVGAPRVDVLVLLLVLLYNIILLESKSSQLCSSEVKKNEGRRSHSQVSVK